MSRKIYVADIETDGLLDVMTKLHCVGLSTEVGGKWIVRSFTTIDVFKRILEDENNIVVGHYFVQFDIPAIKLLVPDIKIKATIVDTLAISWVMDSDRPKHSLESYGEDYGVPKTIVQDGEWLGISKDEQNIIDWYEG